MFSNKGRRAICILPFTPYAVEASSVVCVHDQKQLVGVMMLPPVTRSTHREVVPELGFGA